MMESDYEIATMLSVAGEDIEFVEGIIKAVPGTATFHINNYDSAYEVFRQESSFRIAYTDFVNLNIKELDTFTYAIRTLLLTFEVVSFVNDLVGWVNLKVRLLESGSV